jgi:hypothetical protein
MRWNPQPSCIVGGVIFSLSGVTFPLTLNFAVAYTHAYNGGPCT